MKIYVSIQREVNPSFLELDVSESITAKEVLELPEVKKTLSARNKFLEELG